MHMPSSWQVIVELRRIHQMLFERGPRTSIQGKAHQSFQPVISWKAFQAAGQRCSDVPSSAGGCSTFGSTGSHDVGRDL